MPDTEFCQIRPVRPDNPAPLPDIRPNSPQYRVFKGEVDSRTAREGVSQELPRPGRGHPGADGLQKQGWKHMICSLYQELCPGWANKKPTQKSPPKKTHPKKNTLKKCIFQGFEPKKMKKR